MMEIKELATMEGASKYGSCVECNAISKEEDLIRISFANETSITLCKSCAGQLLNMIKKSLDKEANLNVKKKFKLEDYQGNYIMHCDTEEKAEVFCNFLDSKGKRWITGRLYTAYTFWNEYSRNTCYLFNRGEYGQLDFLKSQGYTILEFDDFEWGGNNESDIND